MARDSAATRARILDAAVEEFALYGLAGGRVDRIAAAAGANKHSIYVYYQSKELLFAAALHQVIGDLTDTVPVTEQDLPGYAGRLFDYLVQHPEALRMSAWRHLERPTAGPDASDVYAQKIEAMTGSKSKDPHNDSPSAAGSELPPIDLLVLIQGLAGAWLVSPADLLAADGSDPHSPARLSAHRAALVEAARRISGGRNEGAVSPEPPGPLSAHATAAAAAPSSTQAGTDAPKRRRRRAFTG